jgi:hypothetical protein
MKVFKYPTILLAILALLILIAYFGAFKNGFVEWDNHHYTTNNVLRLNSIEAVES